MKTKKSLLFFIITVAAMLFLTGCGGKVKKSTTYYSLINSPTGFYIRLQSDGSFHSSLNIRGTYTLKDEKVTFNDEGGAKTTGYIDGEYLFYQAYSGNDNRIPDGDRFDAEMYDGKRTTVIFHADGTVNYDIVQKGLYDFHLAGTYERKGNVIVCSYVYQNKAVEHTYGIKDGILYDAFTSDETRFDADKIATIEIAEKRADESKTSVLAVVIIVGIMILIICSLLFAVYRTKGKNREADGEEKRK